MQAAFKPRVAWLSPLNTGTPTPSVSAYVTDLLLPILKGRINVDLFYDSFESYRDVPTYHYLRAFEKHREKPYDLFFYQIEDGEASYFTRFHCGLVPGVVLFHDLIFVDHGPVPLYVSPWEKVVAKFNDPTVPWPARSEKFEKKGSLGFREGALAGVPVFSSERDHIEFKRNIPNRIGGSAGPSFSLPYPAPVSGPEPRTPGSEFVIAYCGSPRIEHRAHKVLNALAGRTSPYRLLWLIDERERGEVTALLSEFGITCATIVAGRSPAAWSQLISKADVALHTLFSAYGQPGPYLAASLMRGIPSIVTNFGAAEFLPDSVAFKIQAGESEACEIAAVLEKLSSPECRQQIGEGGRRFAEEQFDERAVASELLMIFQNAKPFLDTLSARWDALLADARRAVIAEAQAALVDTSSPFLNPEYSWNRIVKPGLSDFGW